MGVDQGLRAALADRHGLGHGVVRDRRGAHERRHRRSSSRACPTGLSPTACGRSPSAAGRRCWASPPSCRALAHGERWPESMSTSPAWSHRLDRRAVEPRAQRWCAEHVGKGHADRHHLGSTEIGGSAALRPVRPVKPTGSRTPRSACAPTSSTSTGGRSAGDRRARRPLRVAGHDQGVLARRRRALPRRVLAALPQCLARPTWPTSTPTGTGTGSSAPDDTIKVAGMLGSPRGGVAAGRRRPGARGGRDRRPGPGQGRGAGLLRGPARGP